MERVAVTSTDLDAKKSFSVRIDETLEGFGGNKPIMSDRRINDPAYIQTAMKLFRVETENPFVAKYLIQFAKVESLTREGRLDEAGKETMHMRATRSVIIPPASDLPPLNFARRVIFRNHYTTEEELASLVEQVKSSIGD